MHFCKSAFIFQTLILFSSILSGQETLDLKVYNKGLVDGESIKMTVGLALNRNGETNIIFYIPNLSDQVFGKTKNEYSATLSEEAITNLQRTFDNFFRWARTIEIENLGDIYKTINWFENVSLSWLPIARHVATKEICHCDKSISFGIISRGTESNSELHMDMGNSGAGNCNDLLGVDFGHFDFTYNQVVQLRNYFSKTNLAIVLQKLHADRVRLKRAEDLLK